MNESAPLRDLPIAIMVEGVDVRGRVAALYDNDITVEIDSPASGLRTATHIPHYAMGALRVGTSCGLTPYGRRRAEELLLRLYEYSRGTRDGWPVERRSGEKWIRDEIRQ